MRTDMFPYIFVLASKNNTNSYYKYTTIWKIV